jgi:hypothetical protein
MSDLTTRPDSPVVKVAQNLSAITELYEDLLVQAIHKANDKLMPGGEAMVALAPAGSPDDWSENIAAAEFRHIAACPKHNHADCKIAEHVADEDDQEAPLQTLRYWTERWRGYPVESRPTMFTETRYIRARLNWAWQHEDHFDTFAADISAVRTRLENLLYAGNRAERGVPCMYDECKGVRLVRKLVPARGEDGQKTWKHTDWHCPRCRRQWSEERYVAMVVAANEDAKVEHIDGEQWVSVEYAARQVKRGVKTIRTWAGRGLVASACIVRGRRSGFVRLEDVREQDKVSRRRNRPAA